MPASKSGKNRDATKTPTRGPERSDEGAMSRAARTLATFGYLSPLVIGASPVGVLWVLPLAPAVLLVAVRRTQPALAAHVRTSVNIQLWYLIGMFAGFGVLTSAPGDGSALDLAVSGVLSAAASALWLIGPVWGVVASWRARPFRLPRPLRLLAAG
jgi:hypothetical protein